MAIRKTASGKWEARWRTPDGNMRGKAFTQKKMAERFLRDLEVSKDRGTYVEPSLGRVTLSEWWGRYQETATNLRASTRSTYTTMMTRHVLPTLGNKRIAAITRMDVEAWVGKLAQEGVGAPTIRAAHITLRRVLETGVTAGVIGVNHAKGVQTPKGQSSEMRFLSPQEIDRLANTVPSRYRALVLFLAYTGLRIGEAAALRLDSLNLLKGTVRVVEAYSVVNGNMILGECKTKGSKRAVSIPRFVCEELARHLEQFPPGPNGLVFAGEQGAALNRNNFRGRVWLKACEEAGLVKPWPRVHDLRHTSVALAILAGAHPKQIQARAGHSSIVMTMDTYGHLFPGEDQDLADRLDAIGRGDSDVVRMWSAEREENVLPLNSQVSSSSGG